MTHRDTAEQRSTKSPVRQTTTLLVLSVTALILSLGAFVALPLGTVAVPVIVVAIASALVALPILSVRLQQRRFLRDAVARARAAPASASEQRPPAWAIARRDQHHRGEVLRLEEVDGDRVRLVLPGSAAPHDPPAVGEQVHIIDDYDDDFVELWTVATWDSEEFGDAVIQEGWLVEEFERAGRRPGLVRVTGSPEADGPAVAHADEQPSWPTA